MKISVIVPVFNGQDYLERCLDSILNQSFKNIELIVVNDGSIDGTKSIIDKYSNAYPNVIGIHKKNEGSSQARKAGVEASSGEYIGFVDADDYLESDMYEKLYQASRKYKADVVCADVYIDDNGKKKIRGSGKEKVYSGKGALIEVNKKRNIYGSMWDKLYRTKCFQDIVWPVGNFVGEDYYIVTKILENAERVVQLGIPLYHYVQTQGSVCHSDYTKTYWLSLRYYMKRYKEQIKKYPDIERYAKNYLTSAFMSCVIAMGRYQSYDMQMLKIIKGFVRRSFWRYITAWYVGIEYKLALFAFLINYRFLFWGCRKLAL